MARDPETLAAVIDAQLTTRLTAEGITLSVSAVAEWKLWRDVMIDSIHAFEVIQDAFKADTEAFILQKEPAGIFWYVDQCLAFQYGDNLSVTDEGTLYYPNIDVTKQIIKQAGVREVDNGGYRVVLIKIAKQDSGNFVPLLADEKLAFSNYMERVKPPGTNLIITSQNADTITYALTIKYNGLYTAADVTARILIALQSFKEQRFFDAMFYASAMLEAVLKVPGVVAAKFTGLTGTPYGGSPVAITLDYQLQSGYFNFDNASTITLSLA